MKKGLFACFMVLSLLAAGNVGAADYQGSLAVATGGVTATGNWGSAGITFGWDVNDTANPGFWTYKYTLDVLDKGDTSHFIIEVSPTFTTNDIHSFSTGDTNGKATIGTYDASSNGNSNPNMPGSMFGIKVENFNPDNPATFTLVTDRAPVWGDFYAKDGNAGGGTNSAWNTGFLTADPTNPPANGSVGFSILRPDSSGTGVGVPEPGTLLLLGFGLVGLVGVARKRMK